MSSVRAGVAAEAAEALEAPPAGDLAQQHVLLLMPPGQLELRLDAPAASCRRRCPRLRPGRA